MFNWNYGGSESYGGQAGYASAAEFVTYCCIAGVAPSLGDSEKAGVMRRFLRARRKLWWSTALCCALAVGWTPDAMAMSYYEVGHIIAMTTNNGTGGTPDGIMIRLDSGLPDNCAGTTFGWMWIPATSSVLTAYVLGLWLSGNAPSVTVTVYTTGLSMDSFCQVTQIQPSS